MEIKELRGILNHVNATILVQIRERLDADLATSDKRRRQMIWYMWSSGRDQAKLRRIDAVKFSPYSDDYVWFMAGYYDAIFENSRHSSVNNPIAWGLGNE